MLVVFSPIFVADTKIILRYDFIAPLRRTMSEKCHAKMPILYKPCCKYLTWTSGLVLPLTCQLFVVIMVLSLFLLASLQVFLLSI